MNPQDNILAFRKAIFQLIAENKLPEAMSRLLALYPSTDGTYYDDLLLLSRQYKDLTDRQLSGLVSTEAANLEKNRISHALINIVNQLHTDPVVAQHFGLPQLDNESQSSPSGNKKLPSWVWLLAAALVLVLVGVFWNSYNTPNDEAMLEVDATETSAEPIDLSEGKEESPIVQEPERTSAKEKPQADVPTRDRKVESTKTDVIERATEKEPSRIDPPAEELATTIPTEEAPTPAAPPPPETSAHSSPKRAKTLQAGQSTTETLLSRKDVHYYQFLAPEDGRVDFKFQNLTTTYAPTVSVLNPGGNRLIGTMARKGEGLVTWFRTEKGKQYRIEIGARNSDPGRYTLELAYP